MLREIIIKTELYWCYTFWNCYTSTREKCTCV